MSLLLRLQRVSRIHQLTKSSTQQCNQYIYNSMQSITKRSFTDTTPKKVKKKVKKSIKSESIASESSELPLAASQAAIDGGSTTESSRKDWWRMKFYRFRRLCFVIGIPLGLTTAGFAFHESDIPYVYCLKKLASYPLPDGYNPDDYSFPDNPPPNPAPSWAQMIPMLWASQFCAYKPMKIMDQWKYYMPLLDKKYPTETRMVALTCLMGMLSGDPATMPPMVFFDKCMRKLEILQGYKNNENDGYWSVEKFLNMIYGLCGETNNQQLMFGGLQLLMDLTAIPADPKPEAIEYIMEMTRDVPNMKEDIAESLLVIYQDPAVIIDFVHQNPPKPRQKGMLPNFMDIKRILIEHDCLKFAFNLMNSNSMQLKQLAMVLLIGLVGNYPDINEIKQRFGDTPDEKLQNGLRLVDALAGMGQEHLMRGDNQAAFGAFVEACKYLPKSAQLRYLTAKSLAELGQIENAKIEYYKAMNLTPEHAGPMPEATVAYCNLLIKYAKSKADLEEAAEYLEMMIDQGTYQMYQTVEQINIEDIYDRLCICLEKLGRNDDALDRMLNLCKIKPNSHQIHFETGRFAIMCKEYDLAKEHLEFAVSLEPFDMYAKYHLALALFYMGDEESINKSKFEVLKILENKPNDEKCQDLLAKIHIAQNNWNDALKIYETQNAKGNTRAYLQYQIGVAYENLNNEDSAIAAFENSADKWLKYVKQIGYDKYFYQRPKEMKALQKIQSRCVKHGNDQKWSNLKGIVDQIGQY